MTEIARTLQAAGFETWCVGGAVRDALLGVTSLDWDLATAATPPTVRKLFRRTIPVGIEFGTVGVLDAHGIMHEVTTFRRDVKTDGRHAVVEFGASLDDDLARRDFTMNAIAVDPISGRLYDPVGGRADLSRGLVRAVGDPEARLEEDRLRALRAIRFAARFGFDIDVATWQAILHSAPFLPRLSPERVKQELEKTMDQVRRPSIALRRWRDSGAFGTLIPALSGVRDETLFAVDSLPRPGLPSRPQRRVLRLSALFSELDGRTAQRALRALRFSNQDIAWIESMVALWNVDGDRLAVALATGDGVDDVFLRRLAQRTGRLRLAPFLRLAAAKWASQPAETAPTPAQVRALYRRASRVAFHDAVELADLAIDGDDLRQIGIPAGPLYGPLLAALLDDVVSDPTLNARETLLQRARRWLDARAEERPA